MTPWSDRAEELERIKPGRGEFLAFLEWFSVKVDRCLPSGTPPILDTLTGGPPSQWRGGRCRPGRSAAAG